MISIAAKVVARKMPPAVAFKVRSSGPRLMPPPGNSDPPPFPKRSLRSRHQLASCILRLLSQRIKAVVAVVADQGEVLQRLTEGVPEALGRCMAPRPLMTPTNSPASRSS